MLPYGVTGPQWISHDCKQKQERLKRRNTLGCLDQYAAQNSKYARPPQPPTQKVFFQWHTQYDPTMKHSHCETVYTWPWSPNGHGHGHEWPTATLCNVNQPSHSEVQLLQNLTMKIHGQGHVCGQRSRSHLTFKIQRSRSWPRSNLTVTFEALSSIDMFAFHFVAIAHFWLRYSKFYIWPWKFKVKVMAKVKPDGHIWAPEFNQYVCSSFCGNRTIFGWGHDENRPKSNQVIYRLGPTIGPKMKEIQKVVQKS